MWSRECVWDGEGGRYEFGERGEGGGVCLWKCSFIPRPPPDVIFRFVKCMLGGGETKCMLGGGETKCMLGGGETKYVLGGGETRFEVNSESVNCTAS